ncbi:hypothetical protein GOC68_31390 [Sinorhizobium medicae]|nr:hypothetical protein [Sinorhizobium meliloti]MDX0500640.1 hypothetical protein [Sinorhizobium medicae]
MTSLVERVSRFAVFLRNNDRQSRPLMGGPEVLQSLPYLALQRDKQGETKRQLR